MPDRQAAEAVVADRHHTSRSGAPRPTEAMWENSRQDSSSSGAATRKMRWAPSSSWIWLPKPMGEPDHLA